MSQLTSGYRRIRDTWDSHLANLQANSLKQSLPAMSGPNQLTHRCVSEPSGDKQSWPASVQPEVDFCMTHRAVVNG